MLYSTHPSQFIRPGSEASLIARWTWGLHSWWSSHIIWQPWYLWTDGAARLNSDVCFCAIAGTEMILGRESIRDIHLATIWCFFVTKQHYIFSIQSKSVPWVTSRLLIIFTFPINFRVPTWTVCHPLPGPDLGPAVVTRWGQASALMCHTSHLLLLV